jgi:hypothetical protein
LAAKTPTRFHLVDAIRHPALSFDIREQAAQDPRQRRHPTARVNAAIEPSSGRQRHRTDHRVELAELLEPSAHRVLHVARRRPGRV